MTAAERILEQAAVDGVDIGLRADGQPVVQSTGNKPSAAMLAALREHRAEIVRLLGGSSVLPALATVDSKPVDCEPWRCPGLTIGRRKLEPVEIECNAWIFEPVDSEMTCPFPACPARRKARHQ